MDGADFQNLTAGTYTVQLEAYVTDSHNNLVVAYDYQASAVIQGGRTTQFPAAMNPTTGAFDLGYNFLQASCGTSGVTHLTVQLIDGANQDWSGLSGQSIQCSDGATLHYDYFPGGSFRAVLRGYNASNQQTWGADRTVQVVAGAANQTTITLAACGTSGSGC